MRGGKTCCNSAMKALRTNDERISTSLLGSRDPGIDCKVHFEPDTYYELSF
jgi:hypothetical protein